MMGRLACPADHQQIDGEVKAILTSEEVKTHFLNNAMEIDYRDPNEFAAFIGARSSAGRVWCARPISAWSPEVSSARASAAIHRQGGMNTETHSQLARFVWHPQADRRPVHAAHTRVNSR